MNRTLGLYVSFLYALLLCSLGVQGQTILYVEDFESGGGNWTLNTTDLSSTSIGNNKWLMNNAYAGGNIQANLSFFVCNDLPCFTIAIPSVPNEPTGITNSPQSNYIHITYDPSIFGCVSTVSNAHYLVANTTNICNDRPVENYFAEMDTGMSTIGQTNVTVSWWWTGNTSTIAFGEFYYSVNGGSTWILGMSNLRNQSTWTKDSLTLPAFENQADLRVAFRFVNGDDVAGTGLDHSFSVDQIEVSIPGVIAPPVSNFGTANTMLCETTCVTFTDSSTNAPTSWAWSFPGATPDTSNDQNPTGICYDTAGTYSVTLSATNGAGTHDTTFIAYIDVDTAATVSANLDDIICGGIPYTLSGSMGGAASSVTWTTSGDGTFNDSSLLGAVYTPGSGDIGTVVTLTLTTDDPAGPCGAASHLIGLDVNPLTTASAGPDTTICSAATYTLAGSSIGGNAAAQLWTTSGTGTFNDSSLLSPIYTPSPADTVAGCVTLTITTDDPAGPCDSVSDDMDLCFLTCVLPIPNFSASDTVICETSCINFMDSTLNSPTAWAWSFPGGTPDTSNDQNPTNICYDTAGTYSVSLSTTNSNGTAAVTMSGLIIVSATPTANAGVDDTICDNASYTLSGAVGNGASSALWTTSGDGSFDDSSSVGAIYTPGSADILAGSVDLVLTTDDPAGPCNAVFDSMNLSIVDGPVLDSVVSSNASGCGVADGIAVLFGTGGTTPLQYSINGGAAYVGTTTFVSLATGSYDAVIMDDMGCISNNLGFVISAPGTPAAPIANADATYCDGDAIADLTASGSNIEWFSDGGLTTSLGTGSPLAIAPGVGVTSYFVTQTVSGCQSAADTVVITVNAAPAAPTVSVDTSYCDGDPISDLTASGTNILWYSDAALTSLIGTGSPFSINPGVGTTVYYAIDTVAGCASPVDSAVITITAIPSPPTAGTDSTYCSGAVFADLTSTGSNPLWYSDDALTTLVGSGSSLPISPGIGTTIYYVIDSVSGCVSSADSVTITVNAGPAAPVTGSDSTYCIGDTVVDLVVSGTNVEWFSDSGLTNSLGTDSLLSISPGVGTTIYYATQTVAGCQSAASQVTITVNTCGALVASFTADLTSGCTPLCVNFTNTSTDTISTTIWQFPGSDLGSFLGASPPTICYITPGSYDVTLIINDGTDSDTSEMLGYINVYGPPNILISGNTTLTAGDSTVLSASGGTTYVWSPDSTLSSGTGSTVTASPSGTTTYTVIGTDSNDCMDTTSVIVTVEPIFITTDTAVFVPNIFNPGSGNPDNEMLYVFGNGIESYTLMIFERWGPKVYETSDATQTDLDNGICCKYGIGWDGSYQSSGEELNTAVFDYVLVGTYKSGEAFSRKGSITLLK